MGRPCTSLGAIRSIADCSLDLSLTGHVPEAVGLEWVVGQGQRSIEHTEQILNRLVGHPPDSAAIVAAVDQLAGTGVWMTPPLAVFERLSLARSAEVQDRFRQPEMAYVDSATMGSGVRATRRRSADGGGGPPGGGPQGGR